MGENIFSFKFRNQEIEEYICSNDLEFSIDHNSIILKKMSHFEAYTNTKGKVLEKIESGLKQTRFIRSLPKVVSKDKQFCQDLHNVFVQQTMEAIRENFDQVEDSSKLESNLKQLDVVINDDANKSEKAWRPDNVALNNQAAHDRNIITNAKVKLEQELLKELQDDVEDLEKQVSALSYQIAENTANVKANFRKNEIVVVHRHQNVAF